MSLTPLFVAPPIIQFHVLAALVALILGPLALYRQRRDRLHKVLGYSWVVAMLAAATSAAFIPSAQMAWIGPFGPIHLLIPVTYLSLFRGIRAIRRGDMAAHRRAMAALYWQAMGIAGLFTLVPPRAINRVLFPENGAMGYIVIAVGLALIGLGWRHRWLMPRDG